MPFGFALVVVGNESIEDDSTSARLQKADGLCHQEPLESTAIPFPDARAHKIAVVIQRGDATTATFAMMEPWRWRKFIGATELASGTSILLCRYDYRYWFGYADYRCQCCGGSVFVDVVIFCRK
jgi:hypothetical protein